MKTVRAHAVGWPKCTMAKPHNLHKARRTPIITVSNLTHITCNVWMLTSSN